MKKIFLSGLVFGLVFLAGCITIPEEKKCTVDSDCVGASCCHASEAVNRAYAPNCQGMLCTMECVPGTMDCGQGKVRCVERECGVVMKE